MRCRCKQVVRIVSYCVRSGDQRFELTAYRRRSVDRRVRTKCPDPCQSLQKCLRLGLISNPSMNCLRQALWPALETLCGNNIVCLKVRQRGRYQQARGRWFSLSPAIAGGALFQMTDQQLPAPQAASLVSQVLMSDNPDRCGGHRNGHGPNPELAVAPIRGFLYPSTGYRTLDARTAMFFYATGITPAMIMRLTGIGSQYLGAFVDAKGEYFDGSKTYKMTLPPNIQGRAAPRPPLPHRLRGGRQVRRGRHNGGTRPFQTGSR